MARMLYTPYPEKAPAATPPDDYERIQSSPEMFGGLTAQAEQKAGAQFEKTGETLFNTYDQLASTQAYTEFQRGADDLMYGNPEKGVKGYLSMQGQEAMEALPQIRQKMEQLIGQTKAGLQTTGSQIDFERASRRLQSMQLGLMGRHYDSAEKTWGISTQDGALAGHERAIANTYNDDTFFEHQLQDMRGDAVKRAQLKGENPAAAIAEADSRSVQARLNGALGQRDFAAAARIAQKYGDRLDDKLRAGYENHIHSGVDSTLGDDMLRSAQGRAPASAPLGDGVGGAVANRIKQEAQRQNVDSGLALTTASIESSMGSNLGIRGNMFQLGKNEWASVGGGRMGDTDTDVRNGVAFLAQKKEELASALGREPQPWEIYLAHQQGTGGAIKLLSNPGTPAGQLVGDAAISGNGGDPNAPASAFVGKWRNSFTRTASRVGAAPADAGGDSGTATATAAAPGKSGRFDLGVGDSIGVGFNRAAGLGGVSADSVTMPEAALADAAGSRNPQQVLDFVQTHPERFQGKTVLLSSGLMNAGRDPKAALPIVSAQLDALKGMGANVVLAGVDTGKFGQYNTALAAIADEKGVPFAGPLPTDNVHPGPQGYKQYAANAAKLIAGGAPSRGDSGVITDPALAADINAAPASGAPIPLDGARQPSPPDQLTGQPPALGAAKQPQGATPAPSPPPGMMDLSRAESELARQHAQTVSNLTSDPRGADNPTALAHALQKADVQFRSKQMALTAQKQAITEARNATADQYVQRMMKGPIDPTIVDQIAADQNLDLSTRENLWRIYQQHTKQTVDADLAKYGPKFFDYYKRVTADSSDPNKIRDPSQIYALAAPQPDGSQGLTLAGADKLTAELRAAKVPENVGETKMRDGALAYAKHQLSFEFEIGNFKMRDPKGEDAFNVGFLPAFFKYYAAGIKEGKPPEEIVDKKNLDNLLQPFRRSPAQLAKDQLEAGVEAGGTTGTAQANEPPAGAAAYLKTHPELRDAFEQKYGPGTASAILGAPPVPTAPTAPAPAPPMAR